MNIILYEIKQVVTNDWIHLWIYFHQMQNNLNWFVLKINSHIAVKLIRTLIPYMGFFETDRNKEIFFFSDEMKEKTNKKYCVHITTKQDVNIALFDDNNIDCGRLYDDCLNSSVENCYKCEAILGELHHKSKQWQQHQQQSRDGTSNNQCDKNSFIHKNWLNRFVFYVCVASARLQTAIHIIMSYFVCCFYVFFFLLNSSRFDMSFP